MNTAKTNSTKVRLTGISLLSRALIATSDAELTALMSALPDEHRNAITELADSPDDDVRVSAVREVAVRGKISGEFEQVAMLLSDPCLADCVEQLGENAELPSYDQLAEVLPGLVERHGVAGARLMLASAVAGQAPASQAIMQLLKSHELVALPPVDAVSPRTVVVPTAQELELREIVRVRRKEERQVKQAEGAARRAQSAAARRKN